MNEVVVLVVEPEHNIRRQCHTRRVIRPPTFVSRELRTDTQVRAEPSALVCLSVADLTRRVGDARPRRQEQGLRARDRLFLVPRDEGKLLVLYSGEGTDGD